MAYSFAPLRMSLYDSLTLNFFCILLLMNIWAVHWDYLNNAAVSILASVSWCTCKRLSNAWMRRTAESWNVLQFRRQKSEVVVLSFYISIFRAGVISLGLSGTLMEVEGTLICI